MYLSVIMQMKKLYLHISVRKRVWSKLMHEIEIVLVSIRAYEIWNLFQKLKKIFK